MENSEFSKYIAKLDGLDNSSNSSAVEALKNLEILRKNGTLDKFQNLKTPIERKAFLANNSDFQKFFTNFKSTYLSLSQSFDVFKDLSDKLSGKPEADTEKIESME